VQRHLIARDAVAGNLRVGVDSMAPTRAFTNDEIG
jgi:hypothetical protein